LEPEGTLVINVGRSPTDRNLIDGLVGTIQTVFPSVYVMDVPDTFNSILYATAQPTSVENLYNNLLYLYTRKDIHPLLIDAIQRAVVFQEPTPQSSVVYTDDLAPIELVTNQMILNFVFFGDMESLQ
jgi:hypothetical protein